MKEIKEHKRVLNVENNLFSPFLYSAQKAFKELHEVAEKPGVSEQQRSVLEKRRDKEGQWRRKKGSGED